MPNIEHLEKFFEGMASVVIESVDKFEEYCLKEKLSIITTISKDLEKGRSTGIWSFGSDSFNSQQRGRSSQRTNTSTRSNSLKENQHKDSDVPVKNNKNHPLAESRQFLNDNVQNTASRVFVKLERLTEEFINSSPELASMPIKQEKIDMPPPSKPPIRQTRKRKGIQNVDDNINMEAVHVKEEIIESETKKRKASKRPTPEEQGSSVRDSDVIVTSKAIDTICLNDTVEDLETAKLKKKGKAKKDGSDSSLNTQESESETIQTTRVTRTKTRNAAKKAGQENEKSPNQKQSSSEDDAHLNSQKQDTEANETVRATRTKTRNAKKAEQAETQKRLCESSEEDTQIKNKRTKQRKKEEHKARTSSEYEDAVSDIDSTNKNASNKEKARKGKQKEDEESNIESKESDKKNNDKDIPTVLNETTILSKPTILNEAVVKEKVNTTIVINKMPNGVSPDDLLTDDEDIVSSPAQASKSKRQMFSPYASSPVKKRVEAFEKLKAEVTGGIPIKTNFKMKNHENDATDRKNSQSNIPKHGAIPKHLRTPTAQQKIPRIQCLSADKYTVKTFMDQSTDANVRSHTALKVSQAEFRERELRKRQKEAEASIKKEALIQAAIQEKRKKREERQMKAQQARDAKEKDKQKMLEEAERLKQEKYRQALAEREEKLSRQREEAEKKRLLAMKKAGEEKRKDVKKVVPPYLKYDAPLLPTFDCYDSDDSTSNSKESRPLWQRKEVLVKTLTFSRYVGVHHTRLFGTRPETVDLQQVFPSIEPSKLKRTSSAIWNRSQLAVLAEEDA